MENYESTNHATESHAGNVRFGDYLWQDGKWARVNNMYTSVNSGGRRVVSLHTSRLATTHLASDKVTVHKYPEYLTRQRDELRIGR